MLAPAALFAVIFCAGADAEDSAGAYHLLTAARNTGKERSNTALRQMLFLSNKSAICSMVGAQGLEPWTR
jgi:hypothetical protein